MAKMNYGKVNQKNSARSRGRAYDEFNQENGINQKEKRGTRMVAKWPGWCSKCGYSIFKGDNVIYNGKTRHADCSTIFKFRGKDRIQKGEYNAKRQNY